MFVKYHKINHRKCVYRFEAMSHPTCLYNRHKIMSIFILTAPAGPYTQNVKYGDGPSGVVITCDPQGAAGWQSKI